MARRLTAEQNNKLTLNDNISGTSLELYYRFPTTQERQNFSNMGMTRKNGKVKIQYTEARMKYGALILTGFRDGDFEVPKDNGFAPISSDPQSPNYDPDWKNKVVAMAPDIIELLAIQVFETSVTIGEGDDEETTEQD